MYSFEKDLGDRYLFGRYVLMRYSIEMCLVGDLSIGIYQKVAMKSGSTLKHFCSFSASHGRQSGGIRHL